MFSFLLCFILQIICKLSDCLGLISLFKHWTMSQVRDLNTWTIIKPYRDSMTWQKMRFMWLLKKVDKSSESVLQTSPDHWLGYTRHYG